MKRHRSLRFAGALLAAGLCACLAGCENFDPGALFPDGKKPLPGERRLVFPEGVPGVTQGVPPELMRGAQQQDALAPTPPAREPEEKPKPKAKAKKKAPPQQSAEETPEQQPAQRTQPARAPQPAQAQQTSPWPTPPQTGTFSR